MLEFHLNFLTIQNKYTNRILILIEESNLFFLTPFIFEEKK